MLKFDNKAIGLLLILTKRKHGHVSETNGKCW